MVWGSGPWDQPAANPVPVNRCTAREGRKPVDGRSQAAVAEVPVPSTVDSAGFEHTALIYQGEAEYLAEVPRFVQAALARGEPVLLAVPDFREGPLRDALGTDSRRVVFADRAEGRNPGRLISAVRNFAEKYPGRRVSVVGEPAWPSRSTAELAEAARHEALSNLAFANTPMTALCPYDAAALPADVIATAGQTHPFLSGPGGPRASPSYLGPGTLPPQCLGGLPDPPHEAQALAYREDLGALRTLTRGWSDRAGLPADRSEDLVIAVSELGANTLRHTGAGGTLRIWLNSGELICEVADHGWIVDPLAGRWRPAADDPGGHGLWLVHEVCDLVELRSSEAGGTVIRLHMGVPG